MRVVAIAWALLGSSLLCAPAAAAVLKVGAGKTYAKPCQAIAAATAGDTIEIDPGVYADDSCIISKSLTIRGVGATRPHLQATALIPNKKGIFAIDLNTGPVTVENLELSGAKISVADGNNAAGIRMQGSSLTVRNCYFHDNQNGILAGGTAGYDMTVEGSELAANGNASSGYEHNIYVSGDCKSFTFSHSYSHHAKSGHNLKSRCKLNHILYSRLMDESTGTASYIIDLPEGGRSYVIGNLIQKGPQAENTGAVLSYKCETPSAPMLDLYVVNNTFVSDLNKPTMAFIKACAGNSIQVINNLFVGAGVPVSFSGTYTSQSNLQTTAPGLVNQAAYDYHLAAGSPAIDKGTSPGSGGGESLSPTHQYVHNAGWQPRPVVGITDVGAYEYGTAPIADGGAHDSGIPAKDTRPAKDGVAPSDRAAAGDPAGGDRPAAGGDRPAGSGDGRADGGAAGGSGGCGCVISAPARQRDASVSMIALLVLVLVGGQAWRRRRS